MKRTVLVLILIISIQGILKAQTQTSGGYIQYDPIPTYIPPPVYYQPTPIPQMPMPLYLPPSSNRRAKPQLNLISGYNIFSAKINGQDYSQHYNSARACIVFYNKDSDSNNYMAVLMPGDNTNSSGMMKAVTYKEIPQTSNTYGMTKMTYDWEYEDYPSGKKGSATVTFIKQYRKEGTACLCSIQAAGGENIEFIGLLAN